MIQDINRKRDLKERLKAHPSQNFTDKHHQKIFKKSSSFEEQHSENFQRHPSMMQ